MLPCLSMLHVVTITRFLFITNWPVHRKVAASPTSSTGFELVRTMVGAFWIWRLLPFPPRGTEFTCFSAALYFSFHMVTGGIHPLLETQPIVLTPALLHELSLEGGWCDSSSWGTGKGPVEGKDTI